MKGLLLLKFKMLSIILLIYSAQVAFGSISITTDVPMIIGQEVTVVCKVLSLNNGITLKTARYPATGGQASCFYNKDSCIPAVVPGNPSITFFSNVSIKEFYIRIMSLSCQDATNYTCSQASDGSSTKFIGIDGMLPESPFFFAGQNGELTINTGCVYPVSNVTFTFYYTKQDGSNHIYIPDKYVDNENNYGCECGVNAERTIKIQEETKDYIIVTFYIEIKHTLSPKWTWRSENTNNKYMIKENGATNNDYIRIEVLLVGVIVAVLQ